MNLFAIRIETDKMTKLSECEWFVLFFSTLPWLRFSFHEYERARSCTQAFILCKNFVLVVNSFFSCLLPSQWKQNTHEKEEKKNKNLQLHVNKQLCIHYWCGATKYFVDVNVNSLHMSHYTSFMYRLIYWLSRQKFVSCQPVKLRSSISGPFRLKCNRQRCAVIYTDFYRNINYFEGIKSHKSMNFASMWIYRDFLELSGW